MHSQFKTRLITTEDGSHSLYVPELNEHYHSTYGAIQESKYIYINAGLCMNKLEKLNVLEIGFGTGLNAYLSLLEAEKLNKKIDYTAIELYPLSLNDVKQLNYEEELKSERLAISFLALHESLWDKPIKMTPNFFLHKIKADFSTPNDIKFENCFDVIYFDAFAPEKQPEMWGQEIFDKLYSICNCGAIITTYCAKGIVRRRLQAAGFSVERLSGPPGKREILRGQKI